MLTQAEREITAALLREALRTMEAAPVGDGLHGTTDNFLFCTRGDGVAAMKRALKKLES